MGGDATFVVKKVGKAYGNRTVLKDLDFEIRRGEILGLIGASGAGKTTLLHMLVGFIPATQGSVTFRIPGQQGMREYDVQRQQHLVSRYYGFASQHPSFYEKLTVIENMRYFGEMYDLNPETIERNAEQLLGFMGLKSSAHLLGAHLSGGMKRRLDIACALIHNPPVLILDEPTADLDPVLRTHIWEVLKQINAKGTTIILSSHHLNDLDALCSRIAIIKDGRLVDIDSPDKLKHKYSGTQEIMVETFPGDYDDIVKKLKLEKGTEVRKEGTYLTIGTQQVEAVVMRLLGVLQRNRERLLDLKLIKPNIDDVFVRIYTERQEKKEIPPVDVKDLEGKR